jgi:transcription elongation factor
MPFDRLVDRRRVVNAGSVGMSYGTEGAAWALLGPTVQLRTTAFDTEAAAAAVRGSGYADGEEWVRQYLVEPPSDTDALDVFSGMVDPLD